MNSHIAFHVYLIKYNGDDDVLIGRSFGHSVFFIFGLYYPNCGSVEISLKVYNGTACCGITASIFHFYSLKKQKSLYKV